MRIRRTFVATGLAGALAIGGVTAAIAADPAPDGPPAIAFLANGRVPADALAAGPIAGQLGAPIYTTEQHTLSPEASAALDAGDPQLVIVLGGTVAIADTVVDQVEAATGLTVTDTPTPDGGIIRAAGANRFATATAVADLLAAYDPAYLPVGNQAVDADTVDGHDSSEFALKSDLGAGGGDADTLDGQDSSDFQPAGSYLPADGKADSAGHADTAGDADTLDGQDATAFQPAGNYVEAGGTRTISIPATGLNFDPTDPDTRPQDGGIVWAATHRAAPTWVLEPPADWDGEDVTLELFFHPATDAAGVVDWFIRPQSPSLGDTLVDVPNIGGPGVAAQGSGTFQVQAFTIPASHLSGGDMWQLVMQRGGDEASYPDGVTLHMVTLTYGTE